MEENSGRHVKAEDALRAAKILATCPRERIPMVVQVLEQSGITVDEALYRASAGIASTKEDRLRRERERNDRKNWKETDDELVLYLRQAFDDGIDFKKLREITGLNKTTIYRFLWGRRGEDSTRELIRDGLDELYENRDKDCDGSECMDEHQKLGEVHC